MPTATRDETLAFYKAALAAASYLDRDGPDRLLDSEADAAWRAYDAAIPAAIRFDLILKNLAMLYPAAFAPGPVFDLPGWYDDDPWGVGFERPPRDELEALFRRREAPGDLDAAFDRVREAWSVPPPGSASFASRLTPTTQVLVCGASAASAVAQAFAARDNHEVRTQTLLVSETPASRHLLGVASALGRQQGLPRFLAPVSDADQEVQRRGLPPASLFVFSADATARELRCATALADQWDVRERAEV